MSIGTKTLFSIRKNDSYLKHFVIDDNDDDCNHSYCERGPINFIKSVNQFSYGLEA